MKSISRRTAAAAALVVLGAGALTACGNRTSDTAAASAESCVDTSGDTIKIGSLHSLSGTMAISERTVRDSVELAVEQINADGGVMGKQIETVVEDGASDPAVFAEKAQKLITSDCVAAIFGGWTSSSRKAMLPVVEDNNALLYYPVQYEGLEASENIFYTGATTNQQIVPGLEYLKEQGVESMYLVGSDYVFPQTANRVIKAWAEANDVEILGEDYTPLGSTDFSTIVNKVRTADPDAVFNTLNGDSNVAFFREYTNAGLTAEDTPVVSVSIAEEEVQGIGADNIEGQLTSWNYYQTIESPENTSFVEAFKAKYGENRVTSDPMEAAYTSLFLWKNTVEKAGSFDVAEIQENAGGVSFDAPEGTVTINGDNNHISKTALVGEIRPDGLIYEVWSSGEPIEPDPFLEGYDWAGDLSGN
ncbi:MULTISPECIES: urea ABC transporter substrate-binding protein [Dietzia]|uniref:Urea ABC transporter substrate-binding protein n=1 Tax=Dietzia cercidiphylli TaxID=498199 RepID=A0ABN2I734_9ACTN|nr:urea ABC transporter substrate-binding protein [Dietzia cercidiphylli]MBB1041244.1 urea ABC transporter substrate-binding protein [Dietzia sp. Cai40]MBB1044009.1 urea ABC transporter substrate-binding protein [Dietzia sp. DQ11-44]MBB1057367.1 urea ABC transporter substrate-binding protein [Dietzia sp. B19]MBB1047103.1 urea ABC transporter substrate-binding protein [Dietzia cercidiphylli]MCT1517151.1 urea ABC transporter substrate-binding protein [Dietzia cercidiphylli]